ncbi:hypothetical protein [Chamaesiphon minutus]|uniref:Uncharacterized protein n=1 Tax=Chamaesiphon minutus (strain ATCC 27169 / PCC 6605) TaxID=1173020 RepID=K9UA32_CHAP6|nr:hypothetical protein [Chamaesiphon minutus]AFY91967.1 hypothetical protein Cha6605_0695 [Chamaesiphon minutus PCC 6605]
MKVINIQSTNRIAIVLAMSLVSLCSLAMSATAQPDPEVAIDRLFRDDSAPGSTSQGRELLGSVKKWMGSYQRTLSGRLVAYNADRISLIALKPC